MDISDDGAPTLLPNWMGFPTGHAIVVAVANYHDIGHLPEAVLNDARDIAAVLVSPAYGGYDPAKVIVLLDADATLARVREALAGVAKSSRPDDTVIIYFSGHGALLGAAPDAASALLPVDCNPDSVSETSLSEAEFSAALQLISAQRLVVLIDACHSGGVGILKGAEGEASPRLGYSEKALGRLAQGAGRVLIASSRGSEYSLVDPGGRNSIFTHYLLEALRGEARSHLDGVIRVFEIFNYVSEKVQQTVPGRQHPIFKASDVEDNFPLVLYRGGVKGSGLTAKAKLDSTLWRDLEAIMADLYPAGPNDQEIWARAGGDPSRLSAVGTGRANWFAALRTLRQGGGGMEMRVDRLIKAALDDFPHHVELSALLSAAES